MSVLAHCWRCHGTGEMDLDRGQWTEWVECMTCNGTGDFQERRREASGGRRSDDRGAVGALEKALAILDDPAHDDDARHLARWVVFNATTTTQGGSRP